MRKVNFTSTTSLLVQIHPGTEVNAVEHEGTIYVAAFTLPDIVGTASTPNEPTAEKTVAKKESPVTKAAASVDTATQTEQPKATVAPSKIYTEKELMDMDSKEIEEILTSLGIDYASVPGRNTNKKLRELYLANVSSEAVEHFPEEESNSESAIDFTAKIEEALNKVDSGDIASAADFIKEFPEIEFSEDEIQSVTEMFNKFLLDAEAPVETYVDKFNSFFLGEEVSSDEAPAMKEVSIEELEKGQEVSVFWDIEEDGGFYDGVVESVNKGRNGRVIVTVKYHSDGVSEIIDPTVHTKILVKN